MRLRLLLALAALAAACDRGDDTGVDPTAAATAAEREVVGERGACAAELVGPIAQPLVLTRACSPYLVNQPGMLEVADLTVEPGVHLRFLGDSGLTLTGRFAVAGTAASPVRLGGLDRGASWQGIRFGPEANGRIEHAQVDGASGGAMRHALAIQRGASVQLADVTIDVGGAAPANAPGPAGTVPTAIFLHGEAGADTRLERVTATGYPQGLATMGGAAGALDASNRLGTVEIQGGTITASVTFAADTVYVLGRIDVAGKGAERPRITIEPGATLTFRSMGWLRLERAVLHAVGQAATPIRLTAADERWAGLRLGEGTGGSKLQHALVRAAVGPERDAPVFVDHGGELVVSDVRFEALADTAEAAVIAACESTVNVARATIEGSEAKPVERVGCK